MLNFEIRSVLLSDYRAITFRKLLKKAFKTIQLTFSNRRCIVVSCRQYIILLYQINYLLKLFMEPLIAWTIKIRFQRKRLYALTLFCSAQLITFTFIACTFDSGITTAAKLIRSWIPLRYKLYVVYAQSI